MKKLMLKSVFGLLLSSILALILIPGVVMADWMKMDPPPDVDKAAHGHFNTGTCWQATAANILAGAGYGNGATVQQRADAIYTQLVAHFGLGGGWTDQAISWWLNSANNTWPNNPYTVVTVYGNKNPKNPWANANGAKFVGNELRRCQFVGLSISWPVAGGQVGEGGHAITCWGDEGGPNPLGANPTQVKVTDSDKDNGGDVQTYDYDAYNNPNPGGPNEGNGWYIDYSNNHPYIKHIVTLCPTDDPSDDKNTQKVVYSHRIHQNNSFLNAIDLHYKVGTDVDILSYRTTIDWQTSNSPVITEDGDPPRNLTVDWDLSDNPVPYCTDVTITTEFVLPSWNGIWYDDVHFTYPTPGSIKPGLDWTMTTPAVANPNVSDITGGYVIGSLELHSYQPVKGGKQELISQHRLQHQYSFREDPELHQFILESTPDETDTFVIDSLRFGHSYGLLDDSSMWVFDQWMTYEDSRLLVPGEPIVINIEWEGQLPYPPGDDYIPADLDHDGDVDSDDFSLFSGCFTGPGVPVTHPDCVPADFDLDGDVDCNDWRNFKLAWTGPPQSPPPLPECPEAPTTSQWGLIVLVALLVLSAWVVLRRRTASAC